MGHPQDDPRPPALEKAAVRAGGGRNHRGNLSDWMLLKDNHITGIGITEAVQRCRDLWPARTVHVECDRIEQMVEAIEAGAAAVLLDNMTPDQVRECVVTARQLAERGHPALIEASGGIIARHDRRVLGDRCRPDLGITHHPVGPGPRHRARCLISATFARPERSGLPTVAPVPRSVRRKPSSESASMEVEAPGCLSLGGRP
ncbi:MAG: hypothetical protein V9G12_19790 [Microthrixaceae bacterium]